MADFHQRNEALTLKLWFTVAILLGVPSIEKRCFASAAAPEEYKYECEFVQSGWVLRNYLYLLQIRFSVAVVGYKKLVLLSSQFNYFIRGRTLDVCHEQLLSLFSLSFLRVKTI